MQPISLRFCDWLNQIVYARWFLLPFDLKSGLSFLSISEFSLWESCSALPAWLLLRLRSWKFQGHHTWRVNLCIHIYTKEEIELQILDLSTLFCPLKFEAILILALLHFKIFTLSLNVFIFILALRSIFIRILTVKCLSCLNISWNTSFEML